MWETTVPQREIRCWTMCSWVLLPKEPTSSAFKSNVYSFLLFVGKCSQSRDYTGWLPDWSYSNSHYMLLPQSRIHSHRILYFKYVWLQLEGLLANSTRDPCRQTPSHSHAHQLGIVLYYTSICLYLTFVENKHCKKTFAELQCGLLWYPLDLLQ